MFCDVSEGRTPTYMRHLKLQQEINLHRLLSRFSGSFISNLPRVGCIWRKPGFVTRDEPAIEHLSWQQVLRSWDTSATLSAGNRVQGRDLMQVRSSQVFVTLTSVFDAVHVTPAASGLGSGIGEQCKKSCFFVAFVPYRNCRCRIWRGNREQGCCFLLMKLARGWCESSNPQMCLRS